MARLAVAICQTCRCICYASALTPSSILSFAAVVRCLLCVACFTQSQITRISPFTPLTSIRASLDAPSMVYQTLETVVRIGAFHLVREGIYFAHFTEPLSQPRGQHRLLQLGRRVSSFLHADKPYQYTFPKPLFPRYCFRSPRKTQSQQIARIRKVSQRLVASSKSLTIAEVLHQRAAFVCVFRSRPMVSFLWLAWLLLLFRLQAGWDRDPVIVVFKRAGIVRV